jgi:GH25 family lysozyme M1 (1,4-beta-N-acetylmuramidase)
MDHPASEWSEIPGDGLERLDFWLQHKAAAEEMERTLEALGKPASEMTEKEWTWIQYSRFGRASGCGY